MAVCSRPTFRPGRFALTGFVAALCVSVLLVSGTIADPVPSSTERGVPSFGERLSAAALDRTNHSVRYHGAYVRLDYPGGDVPADTGVCTDVVIRAYRALGIDLQVRVHEDMRAAFDAYPPNWGLSRPDRNIDHRRVPNLRAFFRRHGEALPLSDDPATYRPGDLVTFRLEGRLPHIGIVTSRPSADGKRPLLVHNVGEGPKLEDILFTYERTGHYRYAPGS